MTFLILKFYYKLLLIVYFLKRWQWKKYILWTSKYITSIFNSVNSNYITIKLLLINIFLNVQINWNIIFFDTFFCWFDWQYFDNQKAFVVFVLC